LFPLSASTRRWLLAVTLVPGAGCAASEVRTSDARAPAALVPERRAAPVETVDADLSDRVQLEFVDDFNPPRPAPTETIDAPGVRWDAALGGLSGLDYDHASATLFAISDLPRRFDPRLYRFDVQLTATALHISPKAVSFIHEREPSARGLIDHLDAESITGVGRGPFYVGTENGDDRPNHQEPRILRMDADGLLTGALTLPPSVLPAADGASPRGTRSNLAFEGLALSPSGRWLDAIVESALYQDGEVSSFEHGMLVRLLRWDLHAGGEPVEYFYPVEPIPRPARGTPAGGNNGVAELVSLDERRLLVLERAYVPLVDGQGPNTIRLYETMLPAEPSRTSSVPPLLSKRLVLDLNSIVSQLEPGAQSLDNFEGMTLGPDLPSGDASLLLVTDDNFRQEQRTLFLAFRIARGAR
jgi:hypothetical protein